MTTLSGVLSTLIQQHGLTVTELARRVGIAQPVIYRMVKGETTDPKLGTLIPVAEFFQLTLDQLTGRAPLPLDHNGGNKSAYQPTQVPLISWESAAHQPQPTGNTDVLDYVHTDQLVGDNPYALVVNDTTMRPLFPEGAVLIVDPSLSPQDQDFVIAHLPGQRRPLFKQLFFDGEKVYLCSLNTGFNPIELDNQQKLTFLGVVKSTQIHFQQRRMP